MDNTETPKKGNNFINIIITQAICVLIVIVAVITVKYFFKDDFSQLKKFYDQKIATNTDINEVIK